VAEAPAATDADMARFLKPAKGSEKKETKEVSQKSSALYPCDEECQKKCDKDYEAMIRNPDISNPLPFITWNCKNNYDVYTTDYDPHYSFFDKASGDIMDM
jgi:hypothetical protein